MVKGRHNGDVYTTSETTP